MSGAPPASSMALRRHLRHGLAATPSDPDSPPAFAGLPPDAAARFRHLLPVAPARAAVLVPIVDRPEGATVLLTERAADLRHHAGQIAFPGGRMEAGDAGPVATALRESREEIGLEARHVEVLGFLVDHAVMTGYRITPVVGLVSPGFSLAIDATEVAAVFEVPLSFVLDLANHRLRPRTIGHETVDVYELPYAGHHIWGATAGMLATLARCIGEVDGKERIP